MDLPSLLPTELRYTSVASNDRILLNMLMKIQQDLILFFEYACDDETWCGQHVDFMQGAIQWITNQFFQDKLLMSLAQRTSRAIQKHIRILGELIPNNLTINYGNEHSLEVNSLMWGASSEYLRVLIRQECRDKGKRILNLPHLSRDIFLSLEEFILTGQAKELWQKEEKELLPVLQKASEWEILGLVELIENLLKNSITSNNVFEKLLLAQKKKWPHLKEAGMTFINNLNKGVYLDTSLSELCFEFLNFNDSALAIFERLRLEISCLVISRNLTEHFQFTKVINNCPRMICLDISRSESFSERLRDIPSSLAELHVEECAWLNNVNLGKLLEICPNLTKISLANNTQISYIGWSELQKIHHLQKLDISRCRQLTDDDFKLVLQACRSITHLNLQQCTKLTEFAFYELGRNMPKLIHLDLSRSQISDRALIDLSVRCPYLESLILTGCQNLTDRGIMETIKNTKWLRKLNVAKCSISQEIVEKIKKSIPICEP
jgi:F-box/leucine-rich repeat protein 2/20